MFHDVAQYTDEWNKARRGIPTASNFYLLVDGEGKPKSHDNKERMTYLYRLAAEQVLETTMPPRFQGNDATDWGTENEQAAAEAFMRRKGIDKLEAGGFHTDDDHRFGASPDRMFNNRREAVEIKAPQAWTHIRYMVNGPRERTPGTERYYQQAQGQIMCGGFERVHFWSYYPDPRLASVYLEILPDERFIARLHEQLELFREQLDGVVDWVRRKGNVIELVRAMDDA
jgi:YqaJ-like viral recombinase domain